MDVLTFAADSEPIVLWSIIESGLGIIAGSLATLRPLFRSFFRTVRSVGGSENSSRPDHAGEESRPLEQATTLSQKMDGESNFGSSYRDRPSAESMSGASVRKEPLDPERGHGQQILQVPLPVHHVVGEEMEMKAG
jgi:hypothetical protein